MSPAKLVTPDPSRPLNACHVTMKGGLVGFHVNVGRYSIPPSVKGRFITQFSRAARLRMLRFSAGIEWHNITASTFITLTYPPDAELTTYRERQSHLFRVTRKIEQWLGIKAPGIWRIEWKERLSGISKGNIVPHIHLLLLSVGWIPYKELRESWQKIIGTRTFTQVKVERIEGGRMPAFYLSKYCAKLASPLILDNVPNLNKSGRHYGYLRRSLIPRHDLLEGEISDPARWKLIRAMLVTLAPWIDARYNGGLTLFGDKAELAKEILRQAGIDCTGESG